MKSAPALRYRRATLDLRLLRGRVLDPASGVARRRRAAVVVLALATRLAAKHEQAVLVRVHLASGERALDLAMLLVFAWSAVGLNLPQVYRPVMGAVAGLEERANDRLPTLKEPYQNRSCRCAKLMQWADASWPSSPSSADSTSFRSYACNATCGTAHLPTRSKAPWTFRTGSPVLKLLRRWRWPPARLRRSDRRERREHITSWLFSLHFAAVGGLWYRVAVAGFGTAVAGLSITGIWIWLRKRTKRRLKAGMT